MRWLLAIGVFIVIGAAIYFWPLLSDDSAQWDALAVAQGEIDNSNFSAALGKLQKVVEAYPDFAEAYAAAGDASVGNNDHEGARIYYARALDLDPENAGALYGRGWVAWFAGDLASAETDYRKLVALEPDNFAVYTELERVLYETHRYGDIAEMWKKARERHNDWTLATVNRLNALLRAKEWTLLQAETRAALAEGNDLADSADVLFVSGRVHNESGNHEDAIRVLDKAYRQALKQTPIDKAWVAKVGEELIYAYVWAGRRDEAIAKQQEIQRLTAQ